MQAEREFNTCWALSIWLFGPVLHPASSVLWESATYGFLGLWMGLGQWCVQGEIISPALLITLNPMTVLNILITSLLSHHLGGTRAEGCLYHSTSSPVAPGRRGYIPLWKFPSAPTGQPSHSSGFFRPQNSLTFLILSKVRLVSAFHWYQLWLLSLPLIVFPLSAYVFRNSLVTKLFSIWSLLVSSLFW